MVIFHSYVSLPEGIRTGCGWETPGWATVEGTGKESAIHGTPGTPQIPGVRRKWTPEIPQRMLPSACNQLRKLDVYIYVCIYSKYIYIVYSVVYSVYI